MDSICSAIAYANLKNLIDPANDYVAVRCSHLSENMEKLLYTMGIEAPVYMKNVYPKMRDVMMTTGLSVEADAPLTDYARAYKVSNPSAMPVFDKGEYCGLVDIDDVLHWLMQTMSRENSITHVPTIREVMRSQEQPLQAEDLCRDGKQRLLSLDCRGLAVYEGDQYAGYVTRRCFLDLPRYKVIMVDHNEAEQSIQGVETADVVEIIDHHRLNAMKTSLPLFIDAEPLGSTCTIVHQLYLRNGVRPDRQTAKILLTGLLADTLILKSPTTTYTDIESAHALAAMCRVTVEAYGQELFSHYGSAKVRDPLATTLADFKRYTERGVHIGIGQYEVTALHSPASYEQIFAEALGEICRSEGLDWTMLMITDVIKSRSILISSPYPAEAQLNYERISEHVFDMPGVLSRKKQLLPEILHAIGS